MEKLSGNCGIVVVARPVGETPGITTPPPRPGGRLSDDKLVGATCGDKADTD